MKRTPSRLAGLIDRAQFMPKIPLRAWSIIWIVNCAVLLGYWAGYLLDWWPHNSEVGGACGFVFILLAFTPMEFPARTVWLIKGAQTGGLWCQITEADAQHVMRIHDTQWQLRRVVIKEGETLSDERIDLGG